jgi:hypothetical protein
MYLPNWHANMTVPSVYPATFFATSTLWASGYDVREKKKPSYSGNSSA